MFASSSMVKYSLFLCRGRQLYAVCWAVVAETVKQSRLFAYHIPVIVSNSILQLNKLFLTSWM